MANADTPEDALTARNNGAQGIGLCRTEHMVSFPIFSNLHEQFSSSSYLSYCTLSSCKMT